jgi:phage-related protein
VSVADAYVDLHVNGDNLDGEIRTSVKNSSKAAETEADKGGNRLGSTMAKGFLGGFKKIAGGAGGIGAKVKESFSGFNPKGLFIPALAAAIPFVTSALSALTGALTAFVGAAAQAGGASLSLVGVVGSLVQAKIAASIAFKDFAKAVAGDEKALAAMSPAARNAAKAAGELTKAWGGVRKAIQEQVFKGLDTTISRVAKVTLPVLKEGLSGTGTVLNRLFKDLGRFATSEVFVRKFGTALKGNNTILDTLRKAAVPALRGILNVFIALQPAAGRLSGKIVEVARSFARWSAGKEAAEGIRSFMDRAWKSAGNLWAIVKNLGRTLYNVFSAATPAGDGLLVTLRGLTDRLADFTALASTKNAIAQWAQDSIKVTGQLFNALGRIGQVLAPLFNPNIAGGFLKVFEGVGRIITPIVKVLQGALAPVLKTIGAAFAENEPKFAKFAQLFEAMGPLLKGVGAVIGELVSQSLSTLGTVLAGVSTVLTPVVRVISNALGPILTKFAPAIAAVILAFTNWGGALVRIVPIVGKFLAPLVTLAGWLLKKVGPAVLWIGKVFVGVFKLVPRIVGAASNTVGKHFNGILTVVKKVFGFVKTVISEAFGFVGAIFSRVLPFYASIVRLYFNVVKTVITTVFAVVKRVVLTALTFIRGVFTRVFGFIKAYVTMVFGIYKKIITTALGVIRAVFSRVFGFLRAIVQRTFSGIRNIITNVMGFLRGFFPRTLGAIKNAFSNAWNAIKSGATKALTALKTTIGSKIDDIVTKVKEIPGKILSAAGAFLNAGKDLAGEVFKGIKKGFSAGADFVSDVIDSIRKGLNDTLGLPKRVGGKRIGFTIPGFARGTIAAPGGLALVGERGPEVVDLPRGSKVRTAQATRNMARDSESVQQTSNVVVNQNFYGPTTSGGRLKEIDWTLRYATSGRRERVAGVAVA